VTAHASVPATSSPFDVLARRFARVREFSTNIARRLCPEDMVIQSMTDASPTRWHLAHTSWFFETFVLERWENDFAPFHPGFRYLFNSYYHGVGPQFPRSQRGLLSRPTVDDVLRYREDVDRRVYALLAGSSSADEPETASVIEVGLHHEQQHQELMLTDIKHLFSLNPLRPAFAEGSTQLSAATDTLGWIPHPEGVFELGNLGDGFAFDNEYPRHKQYLHAFELGDRAVTNAEYLEFVEDGGYAQSDLWLSDGWDAVQSGKRGAPLYWERRDGAWWQFTLSGMQPLVGSEPVCHVDYYEADAFATWAGARLPTEAEWEVTAVEQPLSGHFARSGSTPHPRPAPRVSAGAPAQLFGDVWEWTSSAYAAYPGYKPLPGVIGEYNGKFMSGQFVLRGGSCATPEGHIRATYRNFFYPDARWQFSGIRLARDGKR